MNEIDSRNAHMNTPRVKQILQWEQHLPALLREGEWELICYGPGHIVFDDFNTHDESLEFCIKQTFETLQKSVKFCAENYPCFDGVPLERVYIILTETAKMLYILRYELDEDEWD